MNSATKAILAGTLVALALATVWVPCVSWGRPADVLHASEPGSGGIPGVPGPAVEAEDRWSDSLGDYFWIEWGGWSNVHYRPIWSLDDSEGSLEGAALERAVQAGELGRFGVGTIHLFAWLCTLGAILLVGALLGFATHVRGSRAAAAA